MLTRRFTSNTNRSPLSSASLELKAAHNYLVQRYGVFDHAPQTVDDGGESDSARCITVAVHLGPSPREIEHRTALQRKVITSVRNFIFLKLAMFLSSTNKCTIKLLKKQKTKTNKCTKV